MTTATHNYTYLNQQETSNVSRDKCLKEETSLNNISVDIAKDTKAHKCVCRPHLWVMWLLHVHSWAAKMRHSYKKVRYSKKTFTPSNNRSVK